MPPQSRSDRPTDKQPLKKLISFGRENGEALRDGWRPLLFFDLLWKLLSLAFLVPVSALFLSSILRWSGDKAISNFDLAAFFLSPQGILLIVVTATLSFAVVFFELGGLAMISLGALQGKRVTAVRTLLFLGGNIRRLCLLGFYQFLILGGIAISALVVVMIAKTIFLSGGDIYFYLQTKPAGYWITISIAGIAVLAASIASLVLLIRWLFSVPLLLTGNLSPREAMTRSSELVKTIGVPAVVKKLVIWTAGALLIVMISSILQWILEKILIGIAGEEIPRVIASIALLQAVRFILSAAIGFVLATSFALLVARLFSRIQPESAIPKSLASPDTFDQATRLRFGWCLFGVAAGLAMLATGFAHFLTNQIQITDEVAVTAHRGSSIAAPENTMAAITRAIEDGSDYVEIDVQETSDGVVVLIHDTDLRRLAGVSRNTWEVSYAEMKELDIGSWFSDEFAGQRIVTLEEAIEATRGRSKLNIELKFNGRDKQLEAAVARIIAERNFESSCIVMSLDYGAMQRIALMNDRLQRGLTLTARVGNPTAFDVDFLAVSAGSVTRDLVTSAHRAGMEVHVWTVNEPSQMLTMIHLGVDNIITDAPDLLVELLEERAQLTNAEKTLLYLSDILAGRL